MLMRRFQAVLTREVGEWRLALVAAPLLGLVPLVVPWLPGVTASSSSDDVRFAVVFALVASFEGLLILFLGAGIVSREAREGRLSFYFSRPIPGTTLWLGKLSGAVVVVLLSAVLIILPTLAVVQAGTGFDAESLVDMSDGLLRFLEKESPSVPLLAPRETTWLLAFAPWNLPHRSTAMKILTAFFGLLLAIVAVHVLNVMVRRRNAWLLVDLTAAAVTLAVGAAAVDRLVTAQAMGPLAWAERVLLVVVALGAVAACGVALAVGRGDAERTRRLLSTTLWSVVLVAAFGFLGHAHRSLAVDVDDLVTWRLEPTDDGEWLLLTGPTRGAEGYRAAFLRHTRSGRSVELGPATVARHHLTTSRDGSTAVWMRCRRLRTADCELTALDLEAEDGAPRATGIQAVTLSVLVLSDDGRRLAILNRIAWDRRDVEVYDVGSGQLVTALRRGRVIGLQVLDDGRLRLYEHRSADAPDGLVIQELDPGSRQLRETGRIATWNGELVLHPAAEVLLRVGYGPTGFEAYRADTGELLARYAWFQYQEDKIRFLADGRTVVPARDEEGPALFVLAEDGTVERRLTTDGRHVLPGGEIAPGRLVVTLKAPYEDERTLYVLDLASGELEEGRASDLQPMADLATRPFSTATRLMWTDGRVVLWDEASGETRTILEATSKMRM